MDIATTTRPTNCYNMCKKRKDKRWNMSVYLERAIHESHEIQSRIDPLILQPAEKLCP
jgi:hypothetical protein